MLTDPPIWLLDVDGVLNAFGLRTPPGPELRTFKSANGYMIIYHVELLKRLTALHESGRVEVRWLTTWEEQADEFLAEELGLPRNLKVEGRMPYDSYGSEWWKLTAARALYDEGHRLIWTDDELDIWMESITWLDTTDPDQLLSYAPREDIGLTHEFLDQVEEWL